MDIYAPVFEALGQLDLSDIPADWVDAQYSGSFCDPSASPWGMINVTSSVRWQHITLFE
jgi:hypothetical protein